MKIRYILSHPIQYQSPLIKYLYKKGINLKVLYRSNISVKKYYDTGFRKKISWNVNILKGYKYQFLNFIGPNKVSTIYPITTDFFKNIIDKDTDIIWVHGIKNWYNLCIIFLGKIFKKKIFVRDEVTHFSKRRGYLNKLINLIFYNIIDNFIDIYLAIGTENKKYYLDNNIKKNKIIMMPYVVDNDFFKYKKSINNKKINFLFAAKLIKKKGADLLLKSIKFLNKDKKFISSSNFTIVGDGALRVQLKNYVKKNKLKNINFLPFQNQIELKKLYLKSDVFIMPSIIEPWGLTVNEAMASGNAIITSDKVGSSFDLVFNNINGYKFRNNNYQDLAKKIYLIYMKKNLIKKFKKNSIKIINNWDFKRCLIGLKKAIKIIEKKN